MKHTRKNAINTPPGATMPRLLPLFGFLPLLGLGGCGMLGGDRIPEVTNAARLNVAMAAEASGDNQMAVQIYATALAKDPSNTAIAAQYARALVNGRQIALARELLSRQLASHPGHPDLSREFGTIEVLQGQPAAALPRFDMALKANPNDVRALVNKGIALDMLGQHVNAQALYHQADLLSPDDPAVRNNLAMSLMLHGRVAEAGRVMQSVSDGAASTPRIRNNMAVVAAAGGDMARARQLTAGEISEAELRSLATNLQGVSQPGVSQPNMSQPGASQPVERVAMPADTRAVPQAAIARRGRAAEPVSARATVPPTVSPTTPAVASGTDETAGAVPLTVPGQVAAPPARAVPVRVQDKRGAGRLNTTALTPADVTRVLELRMEKEAAFIGAGPSDEPIQLYSMRAGTVPAVASGPVRLLPVVAGPRIARPVALAPAVAMGPRMGYSVQLAAVGSETGARSEWRRLSARLPFHLADRDAVMERATRGDGGVFWRVRTSGFTAYDEARQFCAALKLAGQDCFVTGRAQPQARSVTAPVAIGTVTPGIQSPEG